jgi:hypothetical protein
VRRALAFTLLEWAIAAPLSGRRAQGLLANCVPELDLIDFAPQIAQRPNAADDLVERFPCFGRDLRSPRIDRHWTVRRQNLERPVRKAADQLVY